MKQKALQLSLAVYRLTKLFPEGEVLIGQMRQIANQVLAELISGNPKKAITQINILLYYFQIAQAQQWIKQINFVILFREYNKLLNEINQSKAGDHHKKVVSSKDKRLSQRQKRIFEHIKNQKMVRMKNLSTLFPNLTSRTIRNDLNEMINRKLLFRQGRGRSSFYKFNREIDQGIGK